MANEHAMTTPVVFGIAGNSPGYLAQTGEIAAFSEQAKAELQAAQRPRALFPMFACKSEHRYLEQMPFSASSLILPRDEGAVVQIEPELAFKCDVSYSEQGHVTDLKPHALTLINDATYRNKAVSKLAEKKNWGASSKGLAEQQLNIDSFSEGSSLDHLRLCGFHARNGEWQLCSQDVSVTEYNVFYQSLTDWLIETINQQGDSGAMHDIRSVLKQANQPNQITIAIGAPCYTSYGENHHLAVGDQTFVCVYDDRHFELSDIETMLAEPKESWIVSPHIIWLEQTVY
ncbi:DUF5718 family protein [Vibrio mytili]|uniref:DUF5718 family protein n=1 Tax=Vibrio mytili TaxID=50718 RepID=UPI003C6FA1C5